MKELDFDELDRAVNTFLGDAPAATDAATATDQGLPISPSIENTAVVAETPISNPIQSVVSKRPSGRFMDVVHPSSDMKSASNTVASSREGVTIGRVDQSVSQESSFSPTPQETTQTTDLESQINAPKNEWPDPIDMTPLQSETGDQEPSSLPPVQEPQPPIMPTSQTSPFLTDAKVEKRPLGGQNEVGKSQDVVDLSGISSVPLVDRASDDPVENKKILPPELEADLVSIEAGDATTPAVSTDEKIENRETDETKNSNQLGESVDSRRSAILASSSIPQQYKEQPSSGDQSHAAVFAVDDNPDVLQHPAKKKSGWMTVVWIVLIITVAAGLGAASYFMKLF